VFEGVNFALINERSRLLNEVGTVVSNQFGGSFMEMLKQSDYCAPKLVQLIVKNFDGFRDEAIYQGR